MGAYYNENDPFAAAWLRELLKERLIADGEVDERSIADVQAEDLRGFVQCHFFAGIGGWSYALRLAGWSDDRSVWTGSCPCQPFSSAGAQTGGADPRHLWPTWFRLIRECRPDVVFGEQVEAAIAHGWLDLICDDLEREGYAVGACGLPAASVGAPHIRSRLWFVAESERGAAERQRFNVGTASQDGESEAREQRLWSNAWNGDSISRLAYATGNGRTARIAVGQRSPRGDVERNPAWMGGSSSAGLQRLSGRPIAESSRSPWAEAVWIPCRDGKSRPTQSGLQPLVNGFSNRVGILRGAGNAIVPQVAAEFIGAYLDVKGDH